MADIPAPLTYGRVVGRFDAVLADGADTGELPDLEPLNGRVILEPSVKVFRTVEGVRRILIGRTIECQVVEGVLQGPDGDPEVRLLASDSPGVSPGVDDGPDGVPFRYTATILLDGVRTQPGPITFILPGGTTVDLAVVASVVAPGSVPVVTEAARVAAEAARDQAQAAAMSVQRGVPGGVAGLDLDGDVVDAAGAKVTGGGGAAATITGATAVGLAAGVEPTVTVGGTPTARTFEFGIPAGAKGDPGADAGMQFVRIGPSDPLPAPAAVPLLIFRDDA